MDKLDKKDQIKVWIKKIILYHLLFMNDFDATCERSKPTRVPCIGIEFGIGKCGILVIKRSRYERSYDIKLPDKQEN